MKLKNVLIIMTLLVWPISIAVPSVPNQPIFDYEGDGQLIFSNTHSGELMEIIYKDKKGRYKNDGLDDIDYILRCRLTGDIVEVDTRLIELVDHIQDHFGGGEVEIISGYRSPKLNGLLRKKGRGVASKSLHMEGMAIDIRISGIPTKEIRDYAILLKAGGVGYYPKHDFVHLDVGQVRVW